MRSWGHCLDTADILSRVETIVRDDLDDDDIKLTMSTRASEVDGWDSLAHIRIMVGVERAFDVQFSTSAITNLANVGELVRMVEQALAKA